MSPSPENYSSSTARSPRGVSTKENKAAKALFSVNGMTYSPCAGVIEEAVKRLPGIRDAVVDYLNNRAQVLYYPSFVNVSNSNY